MANRVTVADLQSAIVQPQARVVDTYKGGNAGVNPSGYWRSLAGNLSKVNQNLQQYAASRQPSAADIKALEEEGRILAQKNKGSWQEGVTAGVIPQGASPYMRNGWKGYRGSQAAREMAFQSHQELRSNGVATADYDDESIAAAAITADLQERRMAAMNEGDQDGAYLAGFSQVIEQEEHKMLTALMSERLQANEEKMQQAFNDEVNYTLDNVPPNQMAAAMGALIDNTQATTSMSFQNTNKMAIDAITSAAHRTALMGDYEGSLEILSTLESIKSGTGTLGGTQYGRSQIDDAAGRVIGMQHTAETRAHSRITRGWAYQDRKYTVMAQKIAEENAEWTQQERQRTLADRDVDSNREVTLAEAMVEIRSDPTGDHTDMFDSILSNPKLANLAPKLQSWKDNVNDANIKVYEDPMHIVGTRTRIANGMGSLMEVLDSVDAKTMSQPTALGMIDDWVKQRQYEDRLNSGGNSFQKGVMVDLESGINSGIGGGDMNFDMKAKQRAMSANMYIKSSYLDLQDEHRGREIPNRVFQKWADELQQEIFSSPRFNMTAIGPKEDNPFKGLPPTK